jgi:hypothetical protein
MTMAADVTIGGGMAKNIDARIGIVAFERIGAGTQRTAGFTVNFGMKIVIAIGVQGVMSMNTTACP